MTSSNGNFDSRHCWFSLSKHKSAASRPKITKHVGSHHLFRDPKATVFDSSRPIKFMPDPRGIETFKKGVARVLATLVHGRPLGSGLTASACQMRKMHIRHTSSTQ